jgi:hypothetical protein
LVGFTERIPRVFTWIIMYLGYLLLSYVIKFAILQIRLSAKAF